MTFEGAHNADFTLKAGGPADLSLPGWSCAVIEVVFKPASGGDRAARLEISSNEGEAWKSFILNLSGKGKEVPRFLGYVLRVRKNTPMVVNPAALAAHILDPDGEQVSVGYFSEHSLMGGSVLRENGTSTYHPPADYTGVDLFQFDLWNPYGFYVKEWITVRVDDDDGPPPAGTLELGRSGDGPAGLLFQGVPGKTYQIQRSADLESWTVMGTAVASEEGAVPFTDGAPLKERAFYRIVSP